MGFYLEICLENERTENVACFGGYMIAVGGGPARERFVAVPT
jgi:hypothetical protein